MKQILGLVRTGRGLLSARGRRTLSSYVFVQLILAAFDTVALYLISTVFPRKLGSASIVVDTTGWTIGSVVILFSVRSLLSTLFTWRTMKTLAEDESVIGQKNLTSFVRDSSTHAKDFDLNDLYNYVDRGPGAMINGVLFSYYSILAESLTAFAIVATLFYLQPVTAITTSVFFVGIAVLQHKFLSRRSSAAGRDVVASTHVVYGGLGDVFALSKVLAVMPSSSLLTYMKTSREALLSGRLRASFLAILPRYLMELVLALGLAVVAVTTYISGGRAGALSGITVFAAAGFRLLPIVNRVQSLVLQALTTAPSAVLTTSEEIDCQEARVAGSTLGRNILEFDRVSFSYPNADQPALFDLTLELEEGLQYAVIGPSGSGKTTLVDLALGIVQPTSGHIRRSANCRLGYVPQDTHVAQLPLDQNVAIEWDRSEVDIDRVNASVINAGLVSFRDERHADRSLSAFTLSGGQKQRIGLARAFYRSPTLLFLDEVTSSLDAETEDVIMRSVHGLKGRATVVIVAHRLSTVQHADKVIYIDGGRIAGIGKFDELRRRVPQLERQIQLGSLDLEN